MIHMLIGIPGSGKSTYASKLAKELQCTIISTDNVRSSNPTWEEAMIWPEVYRLSAEMLKNGVDAIFDATNITPKVRKRFVDEVEKHGVKVVMGGYYFNTPKEECYKRVIKRNEMPDSLYLPPEVVLSYGEKIIPPTLSEGFVFIKTIENGEIVNELFNK